MNAEKKKMDEWRDATLDEMRRWPTVSMLKKHFADARITRDQGKSPDESASAIYMKYQVKDKEALGIKGWEEEILCSVAKASV